MPDLTIQIEDITMPGSVVNEAMETTKRATEMREAAISRLLGLRDQVEKDLKILGYEEPVIMRPASESPRGRIHIPMSTPTTLPAPAQSKRFRDYTLVQAVRELLTEAGKPLHGKDIELKVRAGGIKTSMANFQSYLPTSLKRAGGFENTGRNWWVLNEKVKPVRP